MKWPAVMIAIMCAGSAAVAESTINVDLQPGPSGGYYSALYHGQGGLSDPGHDTWNAVSPPVDGYVSTWGSGGNFSFEGTYTSEALYDSSGEPTPVTVSIFRGNPLGTTFSVNPSNTWAYEHVATDARNLMGDYVIAPGSETNRVVINTLVPQEKYTLVLYGAGDQNTHQTTFTVGSVSQTTRGVPNELHPLSEGIEYVVFKDVVSSDGTLVIYYAGVGASHDGNFNGFQLRGAWPQPEPAGDTVPDGSAP